MKTINISARLATDSSFSLAGFRDVDATPHKAAFFEFLDEFAALFREVTETGVDHLQLREGDSVIDVGCGHGACVPLLARRVGASGQIVGIDSSEAMVNEARRRYAHGDICARFLPGNAQALPLKGGRFDAARADRVFLFLDDPRKALDELIRVTRPGARIVVTEGDFGTHAIDASDTHTTRTILAGLCDRVPNGMIGRRLRAMFVEAGLRDTDVQLVPILSTSFVEWNYRLGVERFVAEAIQEGRLDPEAAPAWLTDLKTRDAKGQFTGTALLYLVAGTRPT